jgi:hypothetical protein
MRRAILIVTVAFLFGGCLTNHYDKFYVDTQGDKVMESIHGDAPVEIRTVTTEDDVLDLMEEGYVSIGYSSFVAPYTPLSLVVDTAEEKGAALVLADIRYKEAEQYTSVMYLPSTSTTYTHGHVHANAWSSGGGYAHVNGTYSGSSTTHTLNAVPVQRSRNLYSHDAMFFKKIDTTKLYGVNWFVPKRLPTEASDAPIQVRVLSVLRGSQAEKDGIKRGQIVKAINGVLINTRKDMVPFLDSSVVITKVEVENAK